jgi:gliding motility-associated lipoprotein GldD
MRFTLLSSIVILFLALTSCNSSEEYTPKPRGFFRIQLPPHSYKSFDPSSCPFTFEIPKEGYAIRDTNSLSEPCWWYLLLPKVNGQVYLTYKPLDKNFASFLEDTRTLVYKHTTRASSIDEKVITFSPGVSGIVYAIGGDAASPIQFFVTDSSKHFLRGAVYFNVAPNADSIAPVVAYVQTDIEHMLKTLRWK